MVKCFVINCIKLVKIPFHSTVFSIIHLCPSFFFSYTNQAQNASLNQQVDAEHAAFVRTLPDHVTAPSPHERPIIDKMAQYVARNGAEFELMMRKKNDERFRFLNTWHPLHSYYEHQRDASRPLPKRDRPPPPPTTSRSDGVKIIRAVGVRKASRFDSTAPARGKVQLY